MRGFGAVKEVKKEMDERRASFGGNRVQDFIIKDGEEVEIWFNGTSDEPLLFKEHTARATVNGKERFMREICAADMEKHDGCVFCYLHQNGDKRIGKASHKAAFNVIDTRWVHKITEMRDGRERTMTLPCSDDSKCEHCRKRVPRERAGQRRWAVSLTTAQALAGVNEALERRCACGGKLKKVGYVGPKGKVLPDIDDVDNPEEWEAKHECNKCKKPTPLNIFSVPVTVRRIGSDMKTTYNFMPGAQQDMEDWMTELEPYDLETTVKAFPAASQAERIGVANPFASGARKRATESYGSGDEDPWESDS